MSLIRATVPGLESHKGEVCLSGPREMDLIGPFCSAKVKVRRLISSRFIFRKSLSRLLFICLYPKVPLRAQDAQLLFAFFEV